MAESIPEMTDGHNRNGRPPEWPDEAFLDAVEAHQPAGTTEVADAIGCSEETAYKRLRQLESNGDLASKKVGGNRIWTRG